MNYVRSNYLNLELKGVYPQVANTWGLEIRFEKQENKKIKKIRHVFERLL